jgi:glutaredoxin 3
LPKIEIYTQPWCPYCSRALALLSRKGVSFEEIHAPGGSPERAKSNTLSGKTTVPQIFVDGRLIGDSDRLAALDRAGELDALLAA